jgi:histidinol dehydrogenase
VRDFLKVIPVVGLRPEGAAELARKAVLLARTEELEAHARALELRS